MIANHNADVFATTHTVNSFEPEEYAELVHEVRFDDLFRHPAHVPAFAGFVFRDIRDVGYPGIFAKYKHAINTKGFETLGGYKKDRFYLFKSFLRKSPIRSGRITFCGARTPPARVPSRPIRTRRCSR